MATRWTRTAEGRERRVGCGVVVVVVIIFVLLLCAAPPSHISMPSFRDLYLERVRSLIADPTTTELNVRMEVDLLREVMRMLATNTTIKEVFFGGGSGGDFGDDGAKVVAEAMERNETPPMLNINNQRVGDRGAKALARAIEVNTTVKILTMEANYIGDEGATALAAALRHNHTLLWLDLRCNDRITDVGAEALLGALSKSFAVRTLDFRGRGVSPACIRRGYLQWKVGVARRRLLAMMRLEGVVPKSPLAKFLTADGDHAVAARVLVFLMPPTHT